MIHSVHDVLSTRLCAARDCANDAENGWALCSWCERRRRRGLEIPLHVIPQNVPDTLRCCSCNTFKPDDAFPRTQKNTSRRHRNSECRQCQAQRKHLHRLQHPTTPTRCKALNKGQHDRNDNRTGQPCRGYAQPGSDYCNIHNRARGAP